MSNPLRLALFGAGGIGERHLQLAAEEPECAIVAVADPLAAAAEVAERHRARFYRDYRELLARESLDGQSSPPRTTATPRSASRARSTACRC